MRMRMAWPLSVLVVVLLALAPNDQAAAQGGLKKERYGGIEIGAKGIRAVVVEVVELTKGVFEHRRLMAKTDNPGLGKVDKAGNFHPAALAETLEIIKKFQGEMQQVHKVPPKNIFVVAGSGLPRPPNYAALQEGVHKLTGGNLKDITSEVEVSLLILGIIPRELQADALLFDIGFGGTRGGYYQKEGNAQVAKFNTFGLSAGAFSLVRQVKENLKEKQGDFLEELERLCQLEIGEPLQELIDHKPGLTGRKIIYLNGGAVWALVTFLYPKESLNNHVGIKAADIDHFCKLLRTQPGKLPKLDLSGIQDETVKQRALDDFRAVRDTFTWEQLAAAAEILRTLCLTCQFDQDTQLLFRRDGYISWIAALSELGNKVGGK